MGIGEFLSFGKDKLKILGCKIEGDGDYPSQGACGFEKEDGSKFSINLKTDKERNVHPEITLLTPGANISEQDVNEAKKFTFSHFLGKKRRR